MDSSQDSTDSVSRLYLLKLPLLRQIKKQMKIIMYCGDWRRELQKVQLRFKKVHFRVLFVVFDGFFVFRLVFCC